MVVVLVHTNLNILKDITITIIIFHNSIKLSPQSQKNKNNVKKIITIYMSLRWNLGY